LSKRGVSSSCLLQAHVRPLYGIEAVQLFRRNAELEKQYRWTMPAPMARCSPLARAMTFDYHGSRTSAKDF